MCSISPVGSRFVERGCQRKFRPSTSVPCPTKGYRDSEINPFIEKGLWEVVCRGIQCTRWINVLSDSLQYTVNGRR